MCVKSIPIFQLGKVSIFPSFFGVFLHFNVFGRCLEYLIFLSKIRN